MKKYQHGRRGSGQKGSVMIESAGVLLVFLLIIFGIMDWARVMLANNFVSYAAREATRYAIVHGSSSQHPAQLSDLTSLVKGQAAGLDSSKISVSATWSPNNSPGSTATVRVSYSFQALAPYMPSNMNLSSASSMVIAQ
jgi:Flp pilus assembly protein TadG